MGWTDAYWKIQIEEMERSTGQVMRGDPVATFRTLQSISQRYTMLNKLSKEIMIVTIAGILRDDKKTDDA